MSIRNIFGGDRHDHYDYDQRAAELESRREESKARELLRVTQAEVDRLAAENGALRAQLNDWTAASTTTSFADSDEVSVQSLLDSLAERLRDESAGPFQTMLTPDVLAVFQQWLRITLLLSEPEKRMPGVNAHCAPLVSEEA